MRRILNATPLLRSKQQRPRLPRNRSISTNDASSSSSFSTVRDSIISVICGGVLVSLGGILYHDLYKWRVLNKIERAFDGGYDPVLELSDAASGSRTFDEIDDYHIQRKEQDFIDSVIDGRWDEGRYLLILGAKGDT